MDTNGMRAMLLAIKSKIAPLSQMDDDHKEQREADMHALVNAALAMLDSPVPSISRPMGDIIGPTENIGSTTRDKPAPFLPPLFTK